MQHGSIRATDLIVALSTVIGSGALRLTLIVGLLTKHLEHWYLIATRSGMKGRPLQMQICEYAGMSCVCVVLTSHHSAVSLPRVTNN
jgi:hypothetical protein